MKQALVFFVKNPILGKVKTRIAKDSGDLEALNIYKELLKITKNTTDSLDIQVYIFYDQWIARNDMWSGHQYHFRTQQGHDLGERMLHAFSHLFKEGFGQVVLMGSDCPYILKSHLLDAFNSLSSHDVVFGPTYDGGYYLIGMNELQPRLFLNMKWSIDTVLDCSLERVTDQNLNFHLLEKLEDIDHWEDWKKYKSKYQSKL